jgi:hypothetical protein
MRFALPLAAHAWGYAGRREEQPCGWAGRSEGKGGLADGGRQMKRLVREREPEYAKVPEPEPESQRAREPEPVPVQTAAGLQSMQTDMQTADCRCARRCCLISLWAAGRRGSHFICRRGEEDTGDNFLASCSPSSTTNHHVTIQTTDKEGKQNNRQKPYTSLTSTTLKSLSSARFARASK